MCLDQKKYLINPYEIKKWSEEQIKDQVNTIISIYKIDDETLIGMAKQVNLLSDLLCIYGEEIARLTEKYELSKLQNDIRENKEIYRQRNNYKDTTSEKTPSIKYFEAIASEIVQDDRQDEMQLKADLTRFKRAYESIETKQNAIKKKMETVNYKNG